MEQLPTRNQTENALAWDDLRTSPAFPAMIGGLAGAVGGIALMFIFSRLKRPKMNEPQAYDANGNPISVVYLPSPQEFRILGFTIGDLMTVGSLAFGMYRQYHNMRRIDALERQDQEIREQTANLVAPLNPTPAVDVAKPAAKK
ncbi:hypothetical protein FBQ82_03010 [Anaerolineae bacterium CFX7]|nr:hypothetical protein [Anaerolineae bacterium CFX7]